MQLKNEGVFKMMKKGVTVFYVVPDELITYTEVYDENGQVQFLGRSAPNYQTIVDDLMQNLKIGNPVDNRYIEVTKAPTKLLPTDYLVIFDNACKVRVHKNVIHVSTIKENDGWSYLVS